ncbi:MAG: hypothetical protein MZV63_14775 [Marinilabiliales bacterium]|nr:hypothetical protein [Marinilabiliales bacterium]
MLEKIAQGKLAKFYQGEHTAQPGFCKGQQDDYQAVSAVSQTKILQLLLSKGIL